MATAIDYQIKTLTTAKVASYNDCITTSDGEINHSEIKKNYVCAECDSHVYVIETKLAPKLLQTTSRKFQVFCAKDYRHLGLIKREKKYEVNEIAVPDHPVTFEITLQPWANEIFIRRLNFYLSAGNGNLSEAFEGFLYDLNICGIDYSQMQE